MLTLAGDVGYAIVTPLNGWASVTIFIINVTMYATLCPNKLSLAYMVATSIS